nr:undecaprenyl diphosphate synthase [Candidatus Cloacimonadota bacterium]
MAKDYQELLDLLDLQKLPKHVGIIMDGNGRWAKQRRRPRLYGHRQGAKSVRSNVELGVELGLKYITYYAFSTENWNRPEDEVKGLLKLLKEHLIKEIPNLNKQNIVLKLLGSEQGLDKGYLNEINDMARQTHRNNGMQVNIAFNYGGRLEIVEAIKKLSPKEIAELSPESFGDHLWTAGIPDPDLIIRTSGEMRLSNFLLWQSAYSEFYVTNTLWPDFDKKEMLKALLNYQSRTRKFGGIA